MVVCPHRRRPMATHLAVALTKALLYECCIYCGGVPWSPTKITWSWGWFSAPDTLIYSVSLVVSHLSRDALRMIFTDDKKTMMMIFHWVLMLYYIRYSAGYSILCVLSYVLRSAYRPTIPKAYSYTPIYPTVLTIVHSDGTPSIPPQYKWTLRIQTWFTDFCWALFRWVLCFVSLPRTAVLLLPTRWPTLLS
jgi:hypothetical protein